MVCVQDLSPLSGAPPIVCWTKTAKQVEKDEKKKLRILLWFESDAGLHQSLHADLKKIRRAYNHSSIHMKVKVLSNGRWHDVDFYEPLRHVPTQVTCGYRQCLSKGDAVLLLFIYLHSLDLMHKITMYVGMRLPEKEPYKWAWKRKSVSLSICSLDENSNNRWTGACYFKMLSQSKVLLQSSYLI